MKKIYLLFITLFTVLFQSNAQDVAQTANDINPLLIGQNIPEVLLKTADNKEVSLIDMVKKQPTVIVFYRGGWCPYCNKQLSGLGKISADLVEMGYQILAISPDKPENLQVTFEKHKMTYTLLSDSKMDAARKFGIAFQVDDATLEKYKSYNIDLVDASGNSHNQLPVPSVFFVDKTGEIKFEYVNPDYSVRISDSLLMSAAKSLLEEN
ncbi:peroxiredoxin-like family protein [Sediminitomix flava]|uniref:thioredoxin-dependent peroxiredoxin n=1 Tax=Sediminitomix flava TaxID=379075 RepID=A0A315ZEC8_SEDFL|nr:peroxiredoxin-like family protein [Sediminitomix flava]PWJ43692.1 peroxiredoxin [Sediminitomix flava]